MDYSNTFDSRDAQDRIDELEAEDGLDEDAQEELTALLQLKEETEGAGWEYGIGFIADDHFENYAMYLAEDIGAIDQNARWPNNHIDWEAAAEDLKSDYSTVEFMGTTYWYREA